MKLLHTVLITILTIPTLVSAAPVNPKDIRVVDGDTIWYDGDKYRLMGYDTPETYPSQYKCDYEKALGDQATQVLKDLIGSGQIVDLRPAIGRDKYDRALGHLFVGNVDVGETLINKRLARPYTLGRRQSWCN